ncbi:PilX N-terminal domain-containing pilus assembly protein [Desulfosediminicola flagellatus]|uniref:PilX N-terminal domain-containing pilus assembly protein n=1 Tax=Desulfosediminicola flagellatus TaxID=2569541 RepID=UPI0010ABBCEF|nr:PilX N-terminal domain-containing pilus assembly protein [Desulfosediminicola flagellatus]
MKKDKHNSIDERGFILVISLLILLIVSFLGIMATKSTITEIMISGNDRVHKQTFYQADGGTELAQHLLFQNQICLDSGNGFSKTATIDENDVAILNGSILVSNLGFANSRPSDVAGSISDSTRFFTYYPDATIDDSAAHTNFLNTSRVIPLPGSSQAMISGYDRPGLSSTSGTAKLFTIASQHHGQQNSESTLKVRWMLNNSVVSSSAKSDCKF